MNRTADRDHLLADVLAESTPAGFREALLGETLGRVLRRRRRRQARRAVAGLAGLLLIAALLLRNLPHRIPAAERPVPSYFTIVTQPFPAGGVVHSFPLASGQLIVSAQTTPLIQTTPASGKFRIIGDRELLALLEPHPAVLVRRGPTAEELVFANPADEKAFPLN